MHENFVSFEQFDFESCEIKSSTSSEHLVESSNLTDLIHSLIESIDNSSFSNELFLDFCIDLMFVNKVDFLAFKSLFRLNFL